MQTGANFCKIRAKLCQERCPFRGGERSFQTSSFSCRILVALFFYEKLWDVMKDNGSHFSGINFWQGASKLPRMSFALYFSVSDINCLLKILMKHHRKHLMVRVKQAKRGKNHLKIMRHHHQLQNQRLLWLQKGGRGEQLPRERCVEKYSNYHCGPTENVTFLLHIVQGQLLSILRTLDG